LPIFSFANEIVRFVMNRVWVTGSQGFIGRRLVARLPTGPAAVATWDHSAGRDITEWTQLQSVAPFDVAIHLAGRTFVPGSFAAPRDYYRVNVLGTLNVLELCRQQGARLVFISAYCYGTPQYLPIDEQHPVQATNPYTESKLLGEQLCRAYHRDFGVNSMILRVFNTYGPGQAGDFLIPSILRQLATGRIALQDPAPRRDFVHVDDVVDACIRAAGQTAPGVQCCNIGSGNSISVRDLVNLLVACSGQSVAVEFTGAQRAGEIPDTRSDIRHAQAQLGWRPEIRLEDGVRGLFQQSHSAPEPQ
jgi:UDP-glucose 4-epimerase